MEFGWINVFGTIIVAIMLIPNIIYAIKNKDFENRYNNKLVIILEELGRYASLILTILPVGITGFKNEKYFLFYMIGNSILLLLYLITWLFYYKKKYLLKSLLLAIIPTLVFLLCGITLRHMGLILSSIIFGFAHILITYKNNC